MRGLVEDVQFIDVLLRFAPGVVNEKRHIVHLYCAGSHNSECIAVLFAGKYTVAFIRPVPAYSL